MTYQPSEIADLVLALALGPVLVIAVRQVVPRIPKSGALALIAMFGGYVFTIAEGFVLPDLFNAVEHACYAIAGVLFVVMLLQYRRAAHDGGRGSA